MRGLRTAASLAAGLTLAIAPTAWGQANPSTVDTNNARNNPCSDPWVSLAVSVVKTTSAGPGRAAGSGAAGECDPALYGGGRWSSYSELIQHVRATRQQLASQNVQFAQVDGRGLLVMINPSTGINVANLVGAGAGNIVGAGAGNIVGAGAGNVVPPGYGLQATDGARFAFRLPNGGQLRVRAK